MNTFQAVLALAATLFIVTGIIAVFPERYVAVRQVAEAEMEALVRAQASFSIYRKQSDGPVGYPAVSPARLLVAVEQLKDSGRQVIK